VVSRGGGRSPLDAARDRKCRGGRTRFIAAVEDGCSGRTRCMGLANQSLTLTRYYPQWVALLVRLTWMGPKNMTLRTTDRVGAGKRVALLGAALASAFTAGPAFAASQGTLGATSTGTVAISASVPSRARITGLTDVAFTNQDPAVAASNAQNVCIWSNTATKGYTVTATGSGAASAFTLTNGSGTVPYTVEWAGSSGQTTGTALSTGTASAALTTTAVNQTCSAAPATTASLIVGISTASLGTMDAGSNYTGTLTLVVTPQ
jgi:hypothetical protein